MTPMFRPCEARLAFASIRHACARIEAACARQEAGA
jgi:hypothetical protein